MTRARPALPAAPGHTRPTPHTSPHAPHATRHTPHAPHTTRPTRHTPHAPLLTTHPSRTSRCHFLLLSAQGATEIGISRAESTLRAPHRELRASGAPHGRGGGAERQGHVGEAPVEASTGRIDTSGTPLIQES
jgi:hypothetical protein